jgi:hypothetical protein
VGQGIGENLIFGFQWLGSVLGVAEVVGEGGEIGGVPLAVAVRAGF